MSPVITYGRGMRIRDEQDHEGERVIEAAFGDEDVLSVMRALRTSDAVRASLVATLPEGVVGHVALSRGWLDAPERLVEVLVLSPLSVLPSHQRQGVGTALLEAAAEQADSLGAPAVFLEGDPTYYTGRAGFGPAVPVGFTAPSERIPDPAFQVRLLAAHEPWMRGRLVYPEAFWATDSVGLR